MLEPPMPPDEDERIAGLHQLGVLDTAAEERFDRITRIAALMLDAPMSAVSLVDVDRQWFKSRIGMAASETPRRVSFCGHTILRDQPMVVPDALADPRFVDNPLVLGDPHIRSYAGVPLRDGGGHNVAVLCVMDHTAREFTASQLAALRELAVLAERELRTVGLERALSLHQQAKERIDAITESLVDGFLTVDASGTVLTFNAAAERIFGRDRQTVIGDSVNVLVPEQVRGDFCAECHGLAALSCQAGDPTENAGFGREVTGLRGDGSVFPAELAVSTTFSEGEPLHLVIVRDITDRRRAEDALCHSEKRYRALTDLAPIGIFRVDSAGRFTYVNRRWCTISGISVAEAIGATTVRTLHPEDAERIRAAWRASTEGCCPFHDEHRFLHSDGTVTWVSTTADPQFDDDGLLDGYLGMLQDITEQRAAEAALRDSEAVHRSVVNSMTEGIHIYDRELSIIATNPASDEIIGQELLHSTLSEAFKRCEPVKENGDPFPESEFPAAVTLRTGQPCPDVTMGFRRPDGELRWVSIRSQPLLSEDGAEPWAVCCAFTDITEQLPVEQMKKQFVSLVSHELRTPLTSLRGALGLLAGGAFGSVVEAQQRMLDIAVTNTDRLVRLVNDILDIERIESGTIGLNRLEIESDRLIDHAIQEMRAMADKAEVRLTSTARPARLWADPDRITQTLTNLLSNAIKFSPPGSTVEVSTSERDGFLLIEVKDHGRGIPPDKLDTVFERFQQVDASDSRDKGGTGLGLAICRSIVAQHGGAIWVSSELGAGSTFTFSLPLVPEDIASRAPAPALFVFDAEPAVTTAIRRSLVERGCQVATPTTAADAIRLSYTRPDAILLDVGLPQFDGWRFLAEHRANPMVRDVPVIVVGGESRQLATTVHRAVNTLGVLDRPPLIAHDQRLADHLAAALRERGGTPPSIRTMSATGRSLESSTPDLVLLDLRRPPGSGLPHSDPDGPVQRVVELVTASVRRHVRELACPPERS